MSLTTLTRVRSMLGIAAGVTFHDAAISACVDYANDEVFGRIGQSGGFGLLTVTEYPNVYQDSQSDVYLKHTPISSIVAVTNSDTSVPASGYRFDPESGLVRLLQGTVGSRTAYAYWSTGLDDVQICYAYGWASDTDGVNRLRRAADMLATSAFRRGKAAGVKAEGHTSYRVTYSEEEWPVEVSTILSSFETAFHP